MEFDIINHNLVSIKKQIERIFDNHKKFFYDKDHRQKNPLEELM